jgi:hypothetical protein
MKKLLIIFLAASFAEFSTFAGGTMNFSNGAAGVNAPVRSQLGNDRNWTAELLLVTTNGSFTVVSGVPLQTGELSGYFFGGEVAIPACAEGDTNTFQVRIWNRAQAVIISNPVTVQLGGNMIPPPNLIGLEFAEPLVRPTMKARMEKQLVILSWDANATNFYPEFLNAFGNTWSVLNAPIVSQSGELQIRLTPSDARDFVRLRAQ